MESIVVIGVMAVIMLVISQIFLLNYEMFWKQSLRSGNETGAILASRTISQLARSAADVEASHVFGGTTRTSSDTQLVLKLPSIDGTGSLIFNTYDYVAFYRDATATTKIFSVTEAGSGSVRKSGTRLVTAYNAALYFRYNNPDVTKADRVSVMLINQQTRRGTSVTSRAWTSIFLRDYKST